MKTDSVLLLFLLAFTLVSCSNEIEVLSEDEPFPEPKRVDFEHLKIGDIMLYTYLEGRPCWDHAPCETTYTGDTLALEVIDKIDGKFLIQERITPGSAIFSSEIKYITGVAHDTYESLWDIRNDSLKITSSDPDNPLVESHLVRRLKYPLLEVNENKTEFNGWQTTLPSDVGLANFYISDSKLLGITYPHLNGILVNTPMAYDNDGTTHIYNKVNGIVRVTSISAWTLAGRGWDRIN
jgi:hypothetical protein